MKDDNKVSYATLHLIESEWEALRQKTGTRTKADALKSAVERTLASRKGG